MALWGNYIPQFPMVKSEISDDAVTVIEIMDALVGEYGRNWRQEQDKQLEIARPYSLIGLAIGNTNSKMREIGKSNNYRVGEIYHLSM